MQSIFILVAPSPRGRSSVREILRPLVNSTQAGRGIIRYGSFPLGGGKAGTDRVARQARAFQNAVGRGLAELPVDLPALAATAAADLESRTRATWAAHYRRRAQVASDEDRPAAMAGFYRHLAAIDELTRDEQRRWDDARTLIGDSRPALRRTTETEREWILLRAQRLERAHRAVHEAFVARDSGPAAISAWEDAALEARAAEEAMYPEEFWDDLGRLRAGDDDAIEPALVFLEADPWCFRSGYAKETIVRLLGRHALDPDQQRRLEDVLLRVVDVGDRREFRLYCALARRKASSRLRTELRSRLRSNDRGVARRALLMLISSRRPRLSPEETAIARSIVLDGARRREQRFWSLPSWVGRLARLLWSEDWTEALVSLGMGEGDDRDPALRILGEMPKVRLQDPARSVLATRVLEVVNHGGDESWFERLAPLVDSPELRHSLEQRLEQGDPDIERRAWWAVNAIGRTEERRADP